MPSIREMCDPRVQIAAKICLENNFCKEHFASTDFNVALHRVNRRLTLKRTVSKVEILNQCEIQRLLYFIESRCITNNFSKINIFCEFEKAT